MNGVYGARPALFSGVLGNLGLLAPSEVDLEGGERIVGGMLEAIQGSMIEERRTVSAERWRERVS